MAGSSTTPRVNGRTFDHEIMMTRVVCIIDSGSTGYYTSNPELGLRLTQRGQPRKGSVTVANGKTCPMTHVDDVVLHTRSNIPLLIQQMTFVPTMAPDITLLSVAKLLDTGYRICFDTLTVVTPRGDELNMIRRDNQYSVVLWIPVTHTLHKAFAGEGHDTDSNAEDSYPAPEYEDGDSDHEEPPEAPPTGKEATSNSKASPSQVD